MYPVLVRLGSFELRSYGVIVALATLIGFRLARREAARRGLAPELIDEFASVAVIAGIIGARLYYVLFFDPDLLIRAPVEVLFIWRGGLAIHGALIAGVLTAVWYSRKRSTRFLVLADALTPGIILGQAIGRVACFLNGDAYGTPTDLPWAITFTNPDALAPLGMPLHPTQLYEMGLDLMLFALVWSIRKRPLRSGYLFLIYAAGYGALRFVVEAFRADQLQFAGGVSAAQTLSAVVFAASVVLAWAIRKRDDARAACTR